MVPVPRSQPTNAPLSMTWNTKDLLARSEAPYVTPVARFRATQIFLPVTPGKLQLPVATISCLLDDMFPWKSVPGGILDVVSDPVEETTPAELIVHTNPESPLNI